MKQFLVPTDFSDGSMTAVRYAVALANRTPQAKVVLFAAYHLPPPPADLAFAAIEAYHGRIESDTRKALAELENTVNGQVAMPCEAVCVAGLAADAILAEMAARKPHLTVLGAHGASGIERLFFGSVSSEVAQRTTHPVLVLPTSDRVAEFHNALFATDFQEGDETTAAKIRDWSLVPDDLHVTFIHVADGKVPTLHERAHLEAFQQRARAMENAPDMAFEFVRYPDVTEAVEQRLDDGGFDVLVLVPRHRGWLSRLFDPSVSKALLKHMALPVLVCPGAEG
ncbi:MAG: universal stress protein [Flavobacteriales bacterium]